MSFTTVVPKVCPAFSVRKTKLEMQQATRERKQKVITEVQGRFAENAAISHLAEGESDAAYIWKRKRACFDPPVPSAKRKTMRSLGPANEAEIIARLSQWPEGVPLVWSKLAKEFGITASNGGHTIKELARQHGLDVEGLQGKADIPRMRSKKSKLADGRTSVSCPPLSALKEQVNTLIEDGTLDLGQPRAPSTVHTFKLVNGKLEEVHSEVYGQRFNMLKVRQELLRSHEKLMRLNSDEELNAMTKDDLMSLIPECEIQPNMSIDDMKAKICCLQRTRHLAVWHDHSSVLSRGYMLFTINIVHDNAIFMKMDELAPEHKLSISLQEYVEEPRLCMIAISSSSADDQAALIPDRVDALMELSEPIYTSKGIEIHDKLRFFLGDKKAASFEQGTQCSGNYRCGFCGIHVEKHHDQAHALRRNGRSLKDIQVCALNGTFGGRADIVKPFEGLSIGQLQTELIARGCADIPTTKDKLLEKLKFILGVQRVPSLLLCNPKQTLRSLNLEKYSVMPCEPLHDLKGHLNNLFEALPDILQSPLKEKIEIVIKNTIAGKDSGHTGADLRVCAVRVLAALIDARKAGCHVDTEVMQLMETVVKVSENLYADESKRSSRHILQLYNCCWLHHELCLTLFSHLASTKFFGLYFHALLIHGPIQAEIASSRSLNTEAHERMFCSIKSVTKSCTNRQPAYVMPRLLQCLQAKRIDKEHYKASYSAQRQQDDRVSRDAKQLPPYKGTCLTKDFIGARSNSFQAHLECISPYLECGPDVWWEEVAGNVMFFDGDHHPNKHEKGPTCMHYRSSDLNDVMHRSRECWRHIMLSDIKLSLSDNDIRLYSSSGDFTGFRISIQATEQPSVMENEQSMSEPAEGLVHAILQCSQIGNSPSDTSDMDVTISDEHLNNTLPLISTPVDQGSSGSTSISTNTANCELELNSDESHVVLHTTMVEEEIPANVWVTKYAREIASIIGDSAELREFDKLRARLKAKMKSCLAFAATDYSRHDTLLAILQTLVVTSKNQLKEELTTVESDHVHRYSTLPTDPIHEKAYHKYRHACALLRKWNIAL